ncbi:helix-turn-helix domain-containing protein [Clostridium botulinum]|nr:helix-turn-helix domain-containing protein [Clostridium botulinum]
MKEYLMGQKEFAKMLKIANTTYCQWESGVCNPKLELAFTIAKKLNKKTDEIWYLE